MNREGSELDSLKDKYQVLILQFKLKYKNKKGTLYWENSINFLVQCIYC